MAPPRSAHKTRTVEFVSEHQIQKKKVEKKAGWFDRFMPGFFKKLFTWEDKKPETNSLFDDHVGDDFGDAREQLEENFPSTSTADVITIRDDNDDDDVVVTFSNVNKALNEEPDVVIIKDSSKSSLSEIVISEEAQDSSDDEVEIIGSVNRAVSPQQRSFNSSSALLQPNRLKSLESCKRERITEPYLLYGRLADRNKERFLSERMTPTNVLSAKATPCTPGLYKQRLLDVLVKNFPETPSHSRASSSLSASSTVASTDITRAPRTQIDSEELQKHRENLRILDERNNSLKTRIANFEESVRSTKSLAKCQTTRTRPQHSTVDAVTSALDKFRLQGIVSEREEEKKVDEFPELPGECAELLRRVWSNTLPKDEKFGPDPQHEVTRHDLLTLRPGAWLNDECINGFLQLIQDRSMANSDLPEVHIFNTFFYQTLRNPAKGYKCVARWTRKIDIFAKEILLIPIHLEVHWCMAVIDIGKRRIDYYDSLCGDGEGKLCLRILQEYLQQEAQDKKGANHGFNFADYALNFRKDIPLQENGYDCGVFATRFAEFASRRAAISFKQSHMTYFRQRMVYELVKGKLLNS